MDASHLFAAAQAALRILNPLAKEAEESIIGATWGFRGDLRRLGRRLEAIVALLVDAEIRLTRAETMKLWLKKLELVICDAENLVDEIAYESLRSKLEVGKRQKVSSFFSHSNPLAFRIRIANKVKNVNSLIDSIRREAHEIDHILANVRLNAAAVDNRQTIHFIDESKIVGRDRDVLIVKDMLLGSIVEYDLPVVAIVGMGGLGKTTLAQLLYRDKDVVSYFDERMWICVSDDFNVLRLLNEMMQCITRCELETPNIEGITSKLVEKLVEKLNGKKFLLVLDDVWNTSFKKWENMMNCLQCFGGYNGSKIIVTTRDMGVASTMRIPQSLTHCLSELSLDDSWEMFRKRAFANGGPIENETLVDIGRRMVAQCKGVPLQIISLGGLLYSTQHQKDWEVIEETEMWKSLPNEAGILSVLRLSYDHLPYPCLKQCFAFCSFFPKDSEIQKDELIRQWMGLGYLQSSSRDYLEMEDVGDQYFNILWHNCLLQEVKFDEYNNITSCKMHDLVHDVALLVGKGNCLDLEVREVNENPLHLALHLCKETSLGISKENVRKLRTLSLKGHLPKNIDCVKCVRVLRLIGQDVKKLPSSMRKFIHLRYLDLSDTRIQNLPNFITNLYNLETLVLPSSLQELPKDFHKLVNLRHLSAGERKISLKVMPPLIGHLTSLQTLPLFVVGADMGNKIEELGNLKQLRGRLRVDNLKFVKDKEEAEKADMKGKKDIQKLVLNFGRERPHGDHANVLEGLQPHENLKDLTLEYFRGQQFASWMTSIDSQFLKCLVKIQLKDCVECEKVPPLGRLQHLEVVEMEGLHNLKGIGPEFYGMDEGIVGSRSSSGVARVAIAFPVLRILVLKKMQQLENWSDVSSLPVVASSDMPQLQEWSNVPSLPAVATSTMKFFPHLHKLEIWDCTELKSIPEFKDSTSLHFLEIYNCSELTRLPEGLLQPTLGELRLKKCPKLKTPNSDALRSLTSLETLLLRSCPHWGSYWEEGLVCTTSLRLLSIGDFGEEYRYFPWPSTASPPQSHFTSLEILWLFGWEKVKSLRAQLENLTALRVENLTALRNLHIYGFSGLESLPEWLPHLLSLQILGIHKCPLLEKRCVKYSGEDWDKIAHIPHLQIK